jgi:hypothetical protein
VSRQELSTVHGFSAVCCAVYLLTLISLTACGTREVDIERTSTLERTGPTVTAISEPTRLAVRTSAQISAVRTTTTSPAQPQTTTTVAPLLTPGPRTGVKTGMPYPCRMEGYELYVNQEDGYCFAYPPSFRAGEFSPGQPGIFGPPLDQNLEPLAAMLGIAVKPVPPGSDLSELVDVFLRESAELRVPPITRMPLELGGEPAEILEVVPGREGSRDVLAIHGAGLYRLLFMPSVRDFPRAQPDVEALFEAVRTSFSFLE